MTAALPHPPWSAQPALLRRLLADPQPVLDGLRADHGPVVGLGAGPMRLAVVGGPAALRELYALPTSSFRWGHKYNVLGFVVGEGSMIVSDGADHKRRRSAVQGAFSRRRLNRWVPMIVEQADAAIDGVLDRLDGDEPEVVDLYEVGRGVVLQVVVRALFGERLAARSDEIAALFRGPQRYLELPAARQLPHPLPYTTRARVRADRDRLRALVTGEIAARRAEPTGDPFDVLEALVVDGSLDDDEIRDQVITLMGAGFDTTAATLAWMLWCAALEPGLWDRLRAEADEVYGPPGAGDATPPEDSTPGRLDLAQRVMKETTRLHPAGVVSPREAAEDVTVGGHRIPAGTLVLASAHLAGRDPEAWDDPLRFDPERFVDPTPEQKALADAAWVPFGRGPRQCIGFALAQMELTLIFARLAQRLDVTAPRAEVPRPVGMVVNRPEGGAALLVAPRRGVS